MSKKILEYQDLLEDQFQFQIQLFMIKSKEKISLPFKTFICSFKIFSTCQKLFGQDIGHRYALITVAIKNLYCGASAHWNFTIEYILT